MRMAADRQHLVAAQARNLPLKTVNLLDPETRDWVLTGALWGISALRLPPFVKGMLRTAASISLRNRVAGLMNAHRTLR
jgi:hypothetical protein